MSGNVLGTKLLPDCTKLGDEIKTDAGSFIVRKNIATRQEEFGQFRDLKPVVYLDVRRAKVNRVNLMEQTPERSKVSPPIARPMFIRYVVDIPAMVRPTLCQCQKPHGLKSDDYAVVESDLGILCKTCAQSKSPALVRMVEDFENYTHFTDEDEYNGSSLEVRVIKEISMKDTVQQLRELADSIELKSCFEKVAA